MIQKIIEDWIEKNHIPTVNVEGHLMVSREDLTKLLVKYKTEQLLIHSVVVPKGTLKPLPEDMQEALNETVKRVGKKETDLDNRL